MVILPSHPGIKISIVSNDAILQEYEDDDNDNAQPNVVNRYIEATSGADFGTRCQISAPWPPYTILFKYYIDQKRASGKYIKSEYYKQPSYAYTEKGAISVINGQSFVHKFCFAALTIEDSENFKIQDQDKLMKHIKGMGEITVKAHYVKNLRMVPMVDETPNTDLKEVRTIPEKALKGRTLSHQASLRAPVKSAPASFMDCDYVNPKKQPFATYTFKYRSRDALRSLLIIPRSPSSEPLEDRDVDTLTAEEMRELLRRQRDRDAAARIVKQETGIKRERTRERSSTYTHDADNDDLEVVSTKRLRRAFPTTINENGVEEIDLT